MSKINDSTGGGGKPVNDPVAFAPQPDGSHLTISVGVAHGEQTPASVSWEEADRALRAAKRAGRDRAVDAATLALATA